MCKRSIKKKARKPITAGSTQSSLEFTAIDTLMPVLKTSTGNQHVVVAMVRHVELEKVNTDFETTGAQFAPIFL